MNWAEKAKLGIPAIKQRLNAIRQMYLDQKMAEGTSVEEISQLQQDPVVIDRELHVWEPRPAPGQPKKGGDMAGLADNPVLKAQDAMRENNPDENRWSRTPREVFENNGGQFSPMELELINKKVFDEVYDREFKVLLPDAATATAAQREAAAKEAENRALKEAAKTCPWWEGSRVWLLDANDATVKAANALNLPLGAGLSGTTVRTIENAKQLGVGRPVPDLRVMCVGYLLPISAHSYYEVMAAAGGFTATGKPKDYLAVCPPVNEGEVKALDPGFFEWDGQT
jgi:hypothetical protein